MYVKDLLRDKGSAVFTVSPETSVAELAKSLVRRRIGAAGVVDGEGGLVGVVSERDIVHSVAERGAAAVECEVSELMTKTVHTASPETMIDEVMLLMTERRIRHVPVIEDGKLAGIISIGDVVKHRIASAEREANQLRDYIRA